MPNDFDWLWDDPKPLVEGRVQAAPPEEKDPEGSICEKCGDTHKKNQEHCIKAEPDREVRTDKADTSTDTGEVGDSGGGGSEGEEDGERVDFNAAQKALNNLSEEQIKSFISGFKGGGEVQGLQPASKGEVQARSPPSWPNSRNRSRGERYKDKSILAGSGEGLVVPVHPVRDGEGGGGTGKEVPTLVDRAEEADEGSGSIQARTGSQEAKVRNVAVGLQGDNEGQEQGAFFPRPTGEHIRLVEAKMNDAPWVVRKESEIEYKFPWAPGFTEEQNESYEDQLKGVIPRMGAKSKLRDWLIPRFPKHHTYIEPFGGSFKILLWKVKRSKIEVINDVDSDLIHFFRYMTYWPEELSEMINSLPTHKGLLDALRDELKREALNGLERAAAFYYSVKLSFNGSGHGYAGSVQSLCSARADPTEFLRIANRLRGVDIRCQDAHDLIDSSNRRLDTANYPGGIFYYLDPPYDETAGYATLTSKSMYGKQEQYALFNLAKKIHEAGNKFIMTNSYTEYLTSMWGAVDGWHCIKRMVKYDIAPTAEARKETAELIVSNFELAESETKTRQTGMF